MKSIEVQKAKRFLKELAHMPFIALVFEVEGGEVKVYAKGVSEDSLEHIHTLIDQLASA